MHGVDSPLISAPGLATLLKGDPPTLLDVRYRLGGLPGSVEFARGHIPGAVYVDLDRDLAAPPDQRGRHPLPHADDFGAAMRAAGVRNDRPVVVYDDWAGRAAARCRWLLRWAGHPDVRLLDGGWAAWCAAGGDQSQAATHPDPGDFTVDPGHLPLVAYEDVLAMPALVDARAPQRYSGAQEPVDPVAGHIPGALNRPTEDNLRDDGTFKSAAELQIVYAGLEDAGVYCGSGVTACHDLLAMEIAGLGGSLFAPSWSGWITDPTRPIETGG